ncbi:MAG: helix-turn-helix transcriptional regulator [Hydrogenophaga sp.]|nr:helix-turn-helix transcriptional regulator [Hydrogenophaga sp.]
MNVGNPWSVLIRQLRASLHWSQADLAARMRTDQATVSRWERGVFLPSPSARRTLEKLALDAGVQSLAGVELIVHVSPFPMILVDRHRVVIAASATSGFLRGRSVVDQTPDDERPHLIAFCEALDDGGFWDLATQSVPGKLDYAFERGIETAGAVVVPVVVNGDTYALVQKQPL